MNEFGEENGVERAMIKEGEGGALVDEWSLLMAVFAALSSIVLFQPSSSFALNSLSFSTKLMILSRHSLIIYCWRQIVTKGTQLYDAKAGGWKDLGMLNLRIEQNLKGLWSIILMHILPESYICSLVCHFFGPYNEVSM